MTQVVRVITAAPYDVTIGRDLTQSIADSLPSTASKVLLVHSEVLGARAGALKAAIEGSKPAPQRIVGRFHVHVGKSPGQVLGLEPVGGPAFGLIKLHLRPRRIDAGQRAS